MEQGSWVPLLVRIEFIDHAIPIGPAVGGKPQRLTYSVTGNG